MKKWFLMVIYAGLISGAIAQNKSALKGLSAIDVNPYMPISETYSDVFFKLIK